MAGQRQVVRVFEDARGAHGQRFGHGLEEGAQIVDHLITRAFHGMADRRGYSCAMRLT